MDYCNLWSEKRVWTLSKQFWYIYAFGNLTDIFVTLSRHTEICLWWPQSCLFGEKSSQHFTLWKHLDLATRKVCTSKVLRSSDVQRSHTPATQNWWISLAFPNLSNMVIINKEITPTECPLPISSFLPVKYNQLLQLEEVTANCKHCWYSENAVSIVSEIYLDFTSRWSLATSHHI